MGGKGYTIERTLPFSKEIVWEAWTDRDSFATWFGTDELKMKDVKLDVKVGGTWKGTMVLPDGSEKVWSGVYRELREAGQARDDPHRRAARRRVRDLHAHAQGVRARPRR